MSSSTQVKSNRLCFINESLISVIDNNSVLFINIVYKEKIKVLEIENIIGIGADFFYDGGIIFLRNNDLNSLKVPYIVKVKKNQGNTEEYKSFSLTNTIKVIDTADQRSTRNIIWNGELDIEKSKTDEKYEYTGKADNIDIKCVFENNITGGRRFVCSYYIGNKFLSPLIIYLTAFTL